VIQRSRSKTSALVGVFLGDQPEHLVEQCQGSGAVEHALPCHDIGRLESVSIFDIVGAD